jgi:NADPH-dependent 2,4-dienoyl-CoA reductase/sulfur reductase-like enzyme
MHRVLVVGSGRAGVAAAEELRRAGFAGEIAVLGDEPDGPYDRTACSKGVLTGHQRPRDVRLPVPSGLGVAWHLGRAARLDSRGRTVVTDTGQEFRYDGLVIATGTTPVAPTGWPHGAPRLHHLHSLSGAWALRADLRRARRVAVVGAGVTGCELASAVRALARECVLIDTKPYVMARALGAVVGRHVTDHLAAERVRLRLGRRLRGLGRWRGSWVLELDDGEEIVADLVVGAMGERPDTGWLRGSGLDVADGVRCDASLRAVGADRIVAAGAVARWPNGPHGAEPARVGQWITALEQGQAAARTLLAMITGAVPPPAAVLPRFWSDQFGLRIQVYGRVPPAADVSLAETRPWRRDTARAGIVAAYHENGRVVGLAGVNASRAFTLLAKAVFAETVVTTAPPVPLRVPTRRAPSRLAVAG